MQGIMTVWPLFFVPWVLLCYFVIPHVMMNYLQASEKLSYMVTGVFLAFGPSVLIVIYTIRSLGTLRANIAKK